MQKALPWLAAAAALLGACGDDPSSPLDACGCTSWENCVQDTCEFDRASRWRVIALDAVVPTKDAGGSDWDLLTTAARRPPDPLVCLTLQGQRLCTPVAHDTFKPSWTTTIFPSAEGGLLADGMTVTIFDDDLATRQTICAPSKKRIKRPDFVALSFTFLCQVGSAQASARFSLQQVK